MNAVRFTAATCAVAIAVAVPATASAADPQVAALKRQVAALAKQVNTMQKQVRDARIQLSLNFEGDTCLAAQTADLIQSTWLVFDQVAGRVVFGPQAPVNDYRNCADLAQPDVPRPGISTHPTINPFIPLLHWLHEDVG